ncbi:MAG: hypothetical protein AAF719_13660, partial [Pseudomonadota bacterium]
LAHVSESGTVYVRTDGEWRSWRPETLGGRTGLKPLSIDGPIAKLECLETPCRVETRFGVILLDEGATSPSSPIESQSLDKDASGPILTYMPNNPQVARVHISLRYVQTVGGASLQLGPSGRHVLYSNSSSARRPWS